MKNTLFKLLAVLLITGLGSTISWADANLHFGTGFNTACAQGCAGDPNQVPSTGFDIFNVSGGQSIGPLTQAAPLLLILSVPNTVSATIAANAISSVTFFSGPSNPANSSPGQFSAAATNSSIYETGSHTYSFSNGGFTSGSLYDFLNLVGPTDGSNNFANFTLPGNDAGATSFTVYVFDIYGGTLGGKDLVQIDFSSSLPAGTIAIGYAESGGKNFDNPFTEAGFVAGTTRATPEPASIALFGTGLLGLAGILRRRSSLQK